MSAYQICWATGQKYTVDTYEEACEAVRSGYEDPVIGHDGDLTEGGDRTLCWASWEDAEDDDGARAVCSIYRIGY